MPLSMVVSGETGSDSSKRIRIDNETFYSTSSASTSISNIGGRKIDLFIIDDENELAVCEFKSKDIPVVTMKQKCKSMRLNACNLVIQKRREMVKVPCQWIGLVCRKTQHQYQ